MGVSSAAENQPHKSGERDSNGGLERLGGARGDFVANLGKRRAEIRTTLDLLRNDTTSKRHRDELRRRIHALAAGAKLLRFSRLADELKSLETQLDVAAHRGTVEDVDFGAVQDLIGRMTSLAWGQTEEADPIRPLAVKEGVNHLRHVSELLVPEPAPPRVPIGVLVVGGCALADALNMPSGRASEDDGQAFEVERTFEANVAMDLAKALAPDVAVIDGDIPDGRKLIEELLSDPLTESVPVIVTLKMMRADEAGSFLALGVARVLPKPVSPGELRRACVSVMATYVKREVAREPLGDINLDQLGARLAEEMRRGLCDTVDPQARSTLMKLGEGTEMLAALWGAVARIRDVVTIRTQGQVRFSNGGPEGAFPMAPWLDSSDGVMPESKRSAASRYARADGDASLEKARVLVADDDAAVCWFLAGVLKTAGATVYEARDGERALEIAKHVNPDLIITDILMPKMDGFALCRTLRRDIVLRDVPIVLLSWKEDLLQRVRELGAEADGYLRKEASAGAIVQRVRELVRQRKRISQRVSAQGEIRGRLDGLTTHSLLRLVCQQRENSTVSVRDASYLYEVEVRRGRPVRATRTTQSGEFERGSSVMSALLGVGDGRFAVSPPKEDSEVAPVRTDLSGTFAEQVMPVVATARAAQRLLSGANLMRVKRVEIDEDAIVAYFTATPQPAREVAMAIASGASPRDLLTHGVASARLLEDVLLDAASHGAVIQVIDGGGEDRLPDATALELALLRGERTASPIAALPVLGIPDGGPLPMFGAPMDVRMPEPKALMKQALSAHPPPVAGHLVDAAGNTSAFSAFSAFSGFNASVTPPAAKPVTPQAAPVSFVPQPSLVPTISPPAPLELPTFVDDGGLPDPWSDPVDLSASSSPGLERNHESPPPSSGPRALTPSPSSRGERAARELTPTPSNLPPPPGLKPILTLGSLHPPPVSEQAPVPTPRPKNTKKSPPPGATADKDGAKGTSHEGSDATPRFPRPSAFMAYAAAPKKKDRKTVYWVAFALVGVVFAFWARMSREGTTASESALIADASNGDPNGGAIADATGQAGAETPQQSEAPDARPDPLKAKSEESPIEELPLRDGEKLKKGVGLLEIVAGKSDTVYIDGKPIGSGPVVTLPMKARKEAYEVKVKTRGEERSRFVVVKDNKLVRLRLAPPWQR